MKSSNSTKEIGEKAVAAAILSILLLAFVGGWIYLQFFAEKFVLPPAAEPKAEITAFVQENKDLLFEVMNLQRRDHHSLRLTEIAENSLLDDLNFRGDGKYLELCTDFCGGISISGSCHKIVYYDGNPCQKILSYGEWTPNGRGLKLEEPGYAYYLEEIGDNFYYLYYTT